LNKDTGSQFHSAECPVGTAHSSIRS